jgi:hypothetical protein
MANKEIFSAERVLENYFKTDKRNLCNFGSE